MQYNSVFRDTRAGCAGHLAAFAAISAGAVKLLSLW